MPLSAVQLRPGIFPDETPMGAQPFCIDGNWVRERDGRMQSCGGFSRAIAASLNGACRAALSWADNTGERLLAFACHDALYVFEEGEMRTITPAAGFTAGAIDGSSGSGYGAGGYGSGGFGIGSGAGVPALTWSLANWGETLLANPRDQGLFEWDEGPIPISAVTQANPGVVTYDKTSANAYWLANGRRVVFEDVAGMVELNGNAYAIANLNTSAGTFEIVDTSGFTTYTTGSPDTDTIRMASAIRVANAPHVITSMIVTPEGIVIALGCSDVAAATNYDPLKVRWSDINDYTTWAPATSNSAGSLDLRAGSRIVGGRAGEGESLIWTDTALYSLRYIGGNLVFDLSQIGEKCGLIGPKAMTTVGGQAFWMGNNRQFWTYSGGRPEPLPCPMREIVFDSLPVGQSDKIICATLTEFDEIWWFYPSANDGDGLENSRAVTFNYRTGSWFWHEIARSAFIDKTLEGNPVGVDPTGVVYYHETGDSADGQALDAFLTTADIPLGGLENFGRVRAVMPDLTNVAGNLYMTVKVKPYAQADGRSVGPLSLNGSTKKVYPRARGRLASLTVGGSGVPCAFRLGEILFDIQPEGGRW